MNCYLCYQEAGNATNPALGICHLCGAGVCERHLVLVTSRPVIGMAGLPPTSRSLQCTHCLEEMERAHHPLDRHVRTQEPLTRNTAFWWRRWTWRRLRPLPEPEEAVALVERFLKQQ